jgi:phosphatidate cytidylyltransferase
MLKERIISAISMLSIFSIGFFMEEPWLFMLLVSIVSFIALDELSYLLKLKNLQKIIFLAISLLSFIFFSRSNFIDIKNILYASLIFWVFFVPFHFRLKFQVPKKINLLYGFILIIPLWISITFLFSYNKFLLLFIFVSIFIADIGAYFSGKKFGKHKLMKDVSPGKTIEGVIGAVLLNIIFAVVLGLYAQIDLWLLIAATLLITLLSVVGDLYESLLKRIAGIKDSGSIIPGHGGVLDRIDGFCAVIPIFTLILINYNVLDMFL